MTVEGRTYGGLSPRQRSQERRERLLEAARALIAEHGVAALTVDVVCQRAKLSKRYFYTEFATKDDLLDACADELYVRLKAAMETVLSTTPLADRAHGVLRTVVHTLVVSAADARLYMESPGFPRLRALQQREIGEFTGRIAAEAMPFTGAPKSSVDRQLVTRALVTAATELIIAWLHGDIDTDEDTLVETLTAITVGAAGAI
ncbi:TetR/AcrR family transcriptional regulator [Mycobacterium sp. CVI_P3]|uniref:TetR/AcrR family transcriptional regulator n=1 Tax=Mycobacterium pinniadriaticum TaxID=2994102 RepID=A0ABT3SGH0_9MYCO|nr:TetR/AcrR family transcriptional regulator [Mycobacterium pinniadriaticum]MCX2931941.1 TetR/AcrR family transcriptional regulator [Mycobacterium pinniadriaticum]MCX2938248.1 TetR/AcrR family transcriptional regulator [Mycobacterium pinniadriaticum]